MDLDSPHIRTSLWPAAVLFTPHGRYQQWHFVRAFTESLRQWFNSRPPSSFHSEHISLSHTLRLTDAHSDAAILHNNVLVSYVTERLHWPRFRLAQILHDRRQNCVEAVALCQHSLYGVNSSLLNIFSSSAALDDSRHFEIESKHFLKKCLIFPEKWLRVEIQVGWTHETILTV